MFSLPQVFNSLIGKYLSYRLCMNLDIPVHSKTYMLTSPVEDNVHKILNLPHYFPHDSIHCVFLNCIAKAMIICAILFIWNKLQVNENNVIFFGSPYFLTRKLSICSELPMLSDFSHDIKRGVYCPFDEQAVWWTSAIFAQTRPYLVCKRKNHRSWRTHGSFIDYLLHIG